MEHPLCNKKKKINPALQRFAPDANCTMCTEPIVVEERVNTVNGTYIHSRVNIQYAMGRERNHGER